MEESSNYHVRLVVEQINEEGSYEEVSDHILREFPNDVVDDMEGFKSDTYFNNVIRQCQRISY